VGLYFDKEKVLSQQERVGLLYFTALVMKFDDAVDNEPEFAKPLGRDEFVTSLSIQPVWDTGLTFAELTQQTR
jgi:hypothetical protein